MRLQPHSASAPDGRQVGGALPGRWNRGAAGSQFATAPQSAPIGRQPQHVAAASGTHARLRDRTPHGDESASVSRILRRARLSRWRDLNPPPPVQRYEHDAPGDLLHLDIKGMTRFSEVSLRGDGRLRGNRKHPGFLALHVAVDDHSRMAFTQLLPDQTAETTIGFLHSAVDFFARHGIGVRALLTDNGSSYRSHLFRAACQNLQLLHRRTRPYTPQNQRQSRTLHPNRPARMGLCQTLDRLRAKRRLLAALDPLLQPSPASW